MTRAPRYDGLSPASTGASAAARAASRKRGTGCEVALRAELWRRGLRYRIDVATLPGRPDVVFVGARVAVFCDGDFWHGRDLDARIAKLARGHNAPYWVAKIRANVARDVRHGRALASAGWTVLRYWESDILRDPIAIANEVEGAVTRVRRRAAQAPPRPSPRRDALREPR